MVRAQARSQGGLGLLKAKGRGGGFEAGGMTQASRAGPGEKGELRACPPASLDTHRVTARPRRLQKSTEKKQSAHPHQAGPC